MDRQTRLLNCWRLLNPAQKQDLAEAVLSSVATVSQHANGHKAGSDRFWMVIDMALPQFEKLVGIEQAGAA